MKKALLILSGIIWLVGMSLIIYLDSDLCMNNYLHNSIDCPINVRETTFDINTDYNDGNLISKIKSFSINGKRYDDFSFLLDKNDFVVQVYYMDEDNFPVTVVSFNKNEVLINEDELTGVKSVKLSKKMIKKIKRCNVYAKIMILKGED